MPSTPSGAFAAARALAQRILVYWAAVSLGPLADRQRPGHHQLPVSASLGWLPGGAMLTTRSWLLLPVAMTATAFTLLYVAVPNRDVQSHAAIGGIAAALGFQTDEEPVRRLHRGFRPITWIYGAFAAIPIFLCGIYLSWVVTLLGGWWRRPGRSVLRTCRDAARWPGSAFADSMRVLALLERHRAQRRRHAAPDPRQELRAGTPIPRPCSRNCARRAGRRARREMAEETRWVLIADPGTVKVADVFTRFAFDPALAPAGWTPATARWIHGVARVAALIESGLDVTLAEAFAQPAAAAAPLTRCHELHATGRHVARQRFAPVRRARSRPAQVPAHLAGRPDAILEFCRAIVDATADLVCALAADRLFPRRARRGTARGLIVHIHDNYPGVPVIPMPSAATSAPPPSNTRAEPSSVIAPTRSP